ncbi:hypothetical protein [Bat bocavirus XM30]|uniref:Non-structural protein NP-1 n=1 Tax=Bat bocavirus XM30 TaxID=2259811 RepID=R4KYY0_9VIRU|nr:hypothetical protein [Bat bocavirus XM30]AGL09953.1 hypothetical protein [Bat bocavirus XM30]
MSARSNSSTRSGEASGGMERSRTRSRSPIRRNESYRHRNGVKFSESKKELQLRRNHSSSGASRRSKTTKMTPWAVFSEHRAKTGAGIGYCGFYYHSTRLARAGTDWIFNKGKPLFQSKCTNNVCEWSDVREILFDFKKWIDQSYRNMMWHFKHGQPCARCAYWDDVYGQHLANVKPVPIQDISDEDMLEAAMEVDGAN